jgi:hypothetical protein
MWRLIRWSMLALATYAVVWINTEPVLILAVLLAAGALYLSTFELQAKQQVAAAWLAAATVACWWLIYGRLTPFPEIWEFQVDGQPEPTSGDLFSDVWWFSVVGAALLLAAHGLVRPSRSEALGLAAWAWFGVSVWAVDRGDQDGLWGVSVVVLAMVAAAMLFASSVVALGRSWRGGKRSSAAE